MTEMKEILIQVGSVMFECDWPLTTGPELWSAALISRQRRHALRPSAAHRLSPSWPAAMDMCSQLLFGASPPLTRAPRSLFI